MIEGYALMRGMTVARTFVEKAVSGGKTFVERPAASELVSLLRPGDVVLGAKMDRAFRSGKDALVTLDLFKQRDYDLHLIDLGGSVIKSGVSELIFTIMAGVAQFERHRIRERIRDVKDDQKRRSVFLGGKRPFAPAAWMPSGKGKRSFGSSEAARREAPAGRSQS